MARAIARLASGPAAITTIAAITEANVHRATFCNHFTSVEEVAYAISIGLEEFQLPGYGDRHLGADPASVALRTLRAILDYLTEHRERYRLASSGRSATGLAGITYLLVEQVDSFRVEFGGDHSGSGEAETTADVHMAVGMDGVLSAAAEGTLGSYDARIAEMLFSLLPEWVRQPPAWIAEAHPP